MRCIRLGAILLAMIAFLSPSPLLHACPLCKEAIASPEPGSEEVNNAPAAYNMSIYLMIGVPYTVLCGMGFLIYRGCQKNAAVLGLREQNLGGKMDANETVA